MSVDYDDGLSCIQWRASTRQGRLALDVASPTLQWASVLRHAGMQGLQFKEPGHIGRI